MATRFTLRSVQDGKYIAGDLGWTDLAGKAREFHDAHAADQFVREQKLKDMELVIHRESGTTLRIRISPSQPGANRGDD